MLPCCRFAIQLIGLLVLKLFSKVDLPACCNEFDNLVEHIVFRCPRYADVRHKMWLELWNNFSVDVYIKMASIGVELVLDILLGNHGIINDVLARENVDSFYRMISGFFIHFCAH